MTHGALSAGAAALEVEQLRIAYLRSGVPREVVSDVSFVVERGRSFGLVGNRAVAKHYCFRHHGLFTEERKSSCR